MPDNGSAQAATTWPLVRFQFSVKIGDTEFPAQEVTGLSSETQVIEYRAGNSPLYATVKMPGLKTFSNVIVKKGVFQDDKAMWTLYNKIKMNTFERQSIVISLLDEASVPVMTWYLTNAFPCKITMPDMKSDANEAAIESLELVHEGISLG